MKNLDFLIKNLHFDIKPGGFYCNKLAIEAARKHDMGIYNKNSCFSSDVLLNNHDFPMKNDDYAGMFIISPTDKGGQLYMPPKKFADACGEVTMKSII